MTRNTKAQEQFEEHDKEFRLLPLPPNFPDMCDVQDKRVWSMELHLTELIGSAADFLMSETTHTFSDPLEFTTQCLTSVLVAWGSSTLYQEKVLMFFLLCVYYSRYKHSFSNPSHFTLSLHYYGNDDVSEWAHNLKPNVSSPCLKFLSNVAVDLLFICWGLLGLRFYQYRHIGNLN